MESIRINTGKIQLMVNDDPRRIISFSPSDLGFVERFYKLLAEFDAKQKEYIARAEGIDTQGGAIEAGISLMNEMCNYLRDGIDEVFGTGTSQAAFEDACTLNMFEQFFKGITPSIEKTRSAKMDKYLSRAEDEILR